MARRAGGSLRSMLEVLGVELADEFRAQAGPTWASVRHVNRAPALVRIASGLPLGLALGLVALSPPVRPAYAQGAAPTPAAEAPPAALAEPPPPATDASAQPPVAPAPAPVPADTPPVAAAETAPSTAAPEPAAPALTEPVPSEEQVEAIGDTGHNMQFGARASIGGAYRVVFRYEKSAPCNGPNPDADKKFCGFGGAPMLDLALSFAALNSVEPYLWFRLGLDDEPETNTDPVTIAGAGVRIYTMADAPFKVFIEPGLGVEFEAGGDNPLFSEYEYGADLLFRVGAGAQYDFLKYAGIYVNVGLDLGILRGISSTLEYQGGLQLRAP